MQEGWRDCIYLNDALYDLIGPGRTLKTTRVTSDLKHGHLRSKEAGEGGVDEWREVTGKQIQCHILLLSSLHNMAF